MATKPIFTIEEQDRLTFPEWEILVLSVAHGLSRVPASQPGLRADLIEVLTDLTSDVYPAGGIIGA